MIFATNAKLPEAAFSFAYSSLSSWGKPKPDLVALSSSESQVFNRYINSFVCHAVRGIAGKSQEEIRNTIAELAKELEQSSCYKQNRDRIGYVDFKKLVGVTYTTEENVLVMGIGFTGKQPINNPNQANNSNNPNQTDNEEIANNGFVPFHKGVVNFLVKNADKNDFSVPLLDNGNFLLRENEIKEYSLGKLGKLVIATKGNMNLPERISLSGNKVTANAGFRIAHDLEDVKIPAHLNISFQSEVSDNGFLGEQPKLGSVELTFEGLLLKGVPQYLKETKLIQDIGFDLKTYNNNDRKATISKEFAISSNKQDEVVNQLRDNEKELQKIQAQITLPNAKTQLKEILNKKADLLDQIPILSQNFNCAPEFTRDVKFSIFERKASTSGGNGSASAGIGVSGNVYLNISEAKCSISLFPTFRGESSIYADLTIESNGFVGARADATGSYGIEFKNPKTGGKTFTPKIDKDEFDAFKGIVLKMMEEVENNSEMLNAFLAQVDSKYIEPIISDIEDAFIGSDANPHSVSKLCALLDYIPNPDSHRILPSRNDLKEVCWAASDSNKPLKPIKEVQESLEKFLLPEPQLPSVPSEICDPLGDLPSCASEERCDPTGIAGVITGEDCYTAEFPPGCGAARETAQKINDRINNTCNESRQQINNAINDRNAKLQEWEQKNSKIRADWEQKRDQIEAKFASDLKNWEEQLKRWTKYREPSEIRRIAKSFVIENILRSPIDHKAVATKLLDWSWKVVQGTQDVNDFVDMTNDFLNVLPRDLTLSLKGTSRIAVQTKANFINTRPKIKTESAFGFKDGKPALKVKFAAYKNDNENPKEGYVGGNDLSGYALRMYADTQLFFGDKILASHKLKDIDWSADKIRFSEKISKDETVILNDTVSFEFKK